MATPSEFGRGSLANFRYLLGRGGGEMGLCKTISGQNKQQLARPPPPSTATCPIERGSLLQSIKCF